MLDSDHKATHTNTRIVPLNRMAGSGTIANCHYYSWRKHREMKQVEALLLARELNSMSLNERDIIYTL
jgi:hypothetical protein